EALMSIHDQMERFIREGKRRSGAFHGLSGVVPRRCDLDDVNAEGSQTRASDSDVRSPGLGGDGPRRPVGQLREPLTTARAKIEQVRRAPRVFDNCGRVIPRERLRVDPASKPAEVPSDEGLALGLVEHGVDPISLATPYGLITCGVSLHWMDLAVVLPRFREVLAPGAHLAIVDNQNIHGPYRDEVWKITDRYAATSHHPETPEAVAAVRASGVFRI